jgi:hypothetical protein
LSPSSTDTHANARPLRSAHWDTTRAIAAGATDDEIAEVLLAIAPVTGLGRIATAAPDVAATLGYDVAAALVKPADS